MSQLGSALVVVASAVLLLAGCGTSATEIVVIVRSDASLQLGAIGINVYKSGATTTLATGFPLCVSLSGRAPPSQTPLTLGLVPSATDDVNEFVVEASGYLNASDCPSPPVDVLDRAQVRFTPGKRTQLELVLSQKCEGTTCPLDQTCSPETGSCQSDEQGPLPPFDPSLPPPDLAAPGGDGGLPDLAHTDMTLPPITPTELTLGSNIDSFAISPVSSGGWEAIYVAVNVVSVEPIDPAGAVASPIDVDNTGVAGQVGIVSGPFDQQGDAGIAPTQWVFFHGAPMMGASFVQADYHFSAGFNLDYMDGSPSTSPLALALEPTSQIVRLAYVGLPGAGVHGVTIPNLPGTTEFQLSATAMPTTLGAAAQGSTTLVDWWDSTAPADPVSLELVSGDPQSVSSLSAAQEPMTAAPPALATDGSTYWLLTTDLSSATLTQIRSTTTMPPLPALQGGFSRAFVGGFQPCGTCSTSIAASPTLAVGVFSDVAGQLELVRASLNARFFYEPSPLFATDTFHRVNPQVSYDPVSKHFLIAYQRNDATWAGFIYVPPF